MTWIFKKKEVKNKKKKPTWIVCLESDNGPATNGHRNGVADLCVNEIETVRTVSDVVIAKALSQHVEVETVYVNRMVLDPNKRRVL